jgi:L-ascorbate metabolism protein UlaG (beta-lactamase superfamily)
VRINEWALGLLAAAGVRRHVAPPQLGPTIPTSAGPDPVPTVPAVGNLNISLRIFSPGDDGPVYAGTESGYMIAGEGRTIYFSGDTDVMADMAVYEDLHHPDIGILCAGGHFTMDMERAAYAARKFFNFRTVIPCHYKTFPLLEQSADKLKAGLPGVEVIEPGVMQPIEL